MDELRSDDANELLIFKDVDEVERFKAEKEATGNNAKETVVESVEETVEETYMEKHMDKKGVYNWKAVAEEGDELFEYLIHNYDTMLEGDETVKHFDVGFGWYWLMGDALKIKTQYSGEIQCELVPWIKKEFNKGELFRIDNWKPFRDQDTIIFMFLGYKKLFQFKHYYFQLTISSRCENNTSICTYCEKGDYGRHFGVALYGWKDINHVNLQPVNVLHILDDNMIPDSYWSMKE